MADLTPSDTPTPAQKPLATWRAAFVWSLSYTGNVSAAARYAEVSRQHCYDCREKDPSFAAEWDQALVDAVERLEERAWQRALSEDVQYKFHPKTGQPLRFPEGHPRAGEPYFERIGSDVVLLRLLEAHKPILYKQRTAVDVSATVKQEPAYDLSLLSPEDKLVLLAMKRRLAEAQSQQVAGGKESQADE